MKQRKGIILAGGTGSRLYPITTGVSKQLLPVYDKPMIYYPISTLMLAGIREIAIITTLQDQQQFKRALLDGSQWGISLTYIVQPKPEGLAQAFILAEEFLDGCPSALVLGDNIFYGTDLPTLLANANAKSAGAAVFGYRVADPERYGVFGFDVKGRVKSIVEKPKIAPSSFAVTGLYFVDSSAPRRAKKIEPSDRGELEIIDLLESYLSEGQLDVQLMGRGFAWLDTGTQESLLDAGNFVRTLEKRQGMQIGCLEEIAYDAGWITKAQLIKRSKTLGTGEFGRYVTALVSP